MLSELRSRLTYANLMATVAMFIALGGGAYAAATGSIDSRELKNNNVRSTDLRNNDVRTRDLRNNDVRGGDVRNSTLTGGDVANDGLTGSDVLESSLGQVPSATSANSANTANNLAAPEGFHEVGAPGEPSFQNGCSTSAVGHLETPGFYKDHEGRVHLKGSVTCPSSNQIAFQLPPGYRPADGKALAMATWCPGTGCGGDSVNAVIFGAGVTGPGVTGTPDGSVFVSGTSQSLDGVSFRAEG